MVKHTLASFYARYATAIWPEAHPKNTDSNQRAVERLLGSSTKLDKITAKRLAEMVEEMQRQGKSPSTINTRLSHLKALLSYAVTVEALPEMVAMPWVKRKDNKRMRFLSPVEEDALLLGLGLWTRQIVEVLIDTGMRPGELLQGGTLGRPLGWENVSEDAGGTLPQVVAGPYIIIEDTKTSGFRTVPLTKRAALHFNSWSGLPLQKALSERGLNVDTVSRRVAARARDLGLEDVVLYTMRHTCASRLAQRGAGISQIMDWMGHKNIATTRRYIKLAPKDVFALKSLLE